jgi:hypothetical protein
MIALVVVLASAAAVPQATPTPAPRGATPAAMAMGKATATPPRGKSLGEVARGIRLQFPKGDSKVITNENLKELSGGAELTTSIALPETTSSASGAASTSESQEAQKKALWQERFFAAQQEASRLEAEEALLSQEVARLEREFYSRDDPYQRDNVIKPAWDDAITRLRDVQGRLPAARRAPDEVANAARRDGALPGWFREAPPATPPASGSGTERH